MATKIGTRVRSLVSVPGVVFPITHSPGRLVQDSSLSPRYQRPGHGRISQGGESSSSLLLLSLPGNSPPCNRCIRLGSLDSRHTCMKLTRDGGSCEGDFPP